MTDDASNPVVGETVAVAPRTAGPIIPQPDTASRYDVGPLLGRGGMAEVRLARDTRIDREVAIKLMRKELRGTDHVARFFREARVQGALEHPAVVPIHDLGIDASGTPYFVMKRVGGTTLQEVLAGSSTGRTRSRRELLDLLVDVCLVIELAHQRGVVHRDLKPGNIMLGDFGETYVLDWGIAKVHDSEAIHHVSPMPRLTPHPDLTPVPANTQLGELLGTPGYMAPEQARGEVITTHADVFSLGCILFEILAGKAALPRGSAGLAATLDADYHSPAETAPTADVPPELDALCKLATAAAVARRPSARELADGLRAFLDGDRDLAARKLLAVGHVKAARDSLAVPGASDRDRARAMQEAARALVLDRDNDDAQHLLATLVLEAPAEIPPEALADADLARAKLRQQGLRLVARVYAALAPLFGILFLFDVRAPSIVVASMGLCAVIAGVAWASARELQSPRSPWFVLLLALNGALFAISGLIFGPLLITPIFIIGSLSAVLATSPPSLPAWLIVILHAGPFALDFALELTHLTPRTFQLSHGGVLLTPWVVALTPAAMVIVFSIGFVTQFVNTIVASLVQRRQEEAVRNRLHAQSWHLKQLDPRRVTKS